MKRLWPYALFALILGLTVIGYWNGLNGSFIFDDIPNLTALGDLGGVNSWQAFKIYVFGNHSGPTGRPLSMLSFLINDNNWPANPWGFKLTNLQLHLICGLLLVWANYLLLRAAQWDEADALLPAILAGGIWLLHPFMVSTTLYVVQRMAILSTLFILVGIVGYLKGRLWLIAGRRPQSHAYILMSASLIFGTLLGVLSKENGALLPMLVLVIEIFLWRTATNSTRPKNWWISLFLVLPTLMVFGYLLRSIDLSPNPWQTRDFNLIERLYSETRIVWDYLYQLWIPRIEGHGLYQDGFIISRSLTEPLTTLWAVLGFGVLFAAMPLLYRRYPLIWLAITFFLCGQILESTVLGLELYFEHRNYAPSLFMFLPLAVGIHNLGNKLRPRTSVVVILALLITLFGLTWQRSQIWANPYLLQTYWTIDNPRSARSKNFLASRLADQGKYDEALEMMAGMIKEMPTSPILLMNRLRMSVNAHKATPEDFIKTAEILAYRPFDAQGLNILDKIVNDVIRTEDLANYQLPTLGFIHLMNAPGSYRKTPGFMQMTAYHQARLYRTLGDARQAQEYYLLAMNRYGTAKLGLEMFVEMAESGYIQEASEMLDTLEKGIAAGTYSVQPLGAAHYQQEIARMRRILQDSIEAQQKQQPQN